MWRVDWKAGVWRVWIRLRDEYGGKQEGERPGGPLLGTLEFDSWFLVQEDLCFCSHCPHRVAQGCWRLGRKGSAWGLWQPYPWDEGPISGPFGIRAKLCPGHISQMSFCLLTYSGQEHLKAWLMVWPQPGVNSTLQLLPKATSTILVTGSDSSYKNTVVLDPLV